MGASNLITVPRDDACDTVACPAGHYMLQHAIERLETDAAKGR